VGVSKRRKNSVLDRFQLGSELDRERSDAKTGKSGSPWTRAKGGGGRKKGTSSASYQDGGGEDQENEKVTSGSRGHIGLQVLSRRRGEKGVTRGGIGGEGQRTRKRYCAIVRDTKRS